MDTQVMDPVVKQAIAILRGGVKICKVVLMDENDVIISMTTIKGGLPFKEGQHADVTVAIVEGASDVEGD